MTEVPIGSVEEPSDFTEENMTDVEVVNPTQFDFTEVLEVEDDQD
jgi:hypothetical protein